MITGATKVYVIVGHPILQVKSPEIFNSRFRQEKIDAVMIPLDIRPGGLPAFVACLRTSQNIHGSIVTIPYKAEITQYIDQPSPQVAAIGVANVLRLTTDGKIEADMTDGRGFLKALAQKDVTVLDKHLLIIGCGGAGAAVAWDALDAGADRVSLMDIDRARAMDLKNKLASYCPPKSIEVVSDVPAAFDIVLNATPLGMATADPLPVPIARIPEGAVVADAVTAPPLTPFLKAARKMGHIIQSGPEMAAGQAPLIAEYFGIKW